MPVSSRQELKDYCLRRLGAPVIDINVDEEQVQDRIDDALQKFRDYHADGTERVYYKVKLTAADISNQYLSLPEGMVGVIGIMRIGNGVFSASSLFDARYQMHLNDFILGNGIYSNQSYVSYVMAMRHMETIEEIFVGDKPIRFNKHLDRINIDMDWNIVNVDDYVIIDGYMVVDPETYTDVWNDSWLKKYATALIKRQWGENLKKFEGMQLPGGVQFNGQKIWDEAEEEIRTIEESINNSASLPVMDMIG